MNQLVVSYFAQSLTVSVQRQEIKLDRLEPNYHKIDSGNTKAMNERPNVPFL